MRTYYRGPDAFVTASRFVWLADTTKTFSVRELRDVHRVEHVPQRRPADRVMAAAVGSVVFAAASWLVLGFVIGVTVTAMAVAGTVVAVSTRRLRDTRSYRVIATVRGTRTVIYETRDLRVFNQVTRALRRALEDDRRSHAHYGLVAA